MGYRSDVIIALKTDDYNRLKDRSCLITATTVSGTYEGTDYTMLSVDYTKWYGIWDTTDRKHAISQQWVRDQEDFMDELKKLDFYNFIRTGEYIDDVEEHYSGDTKLIEVSWIKSEGEDKPLPLVIYNEDVFHEDILNKDD